MDRTEEIIEFARKVPHTILEIMTKFNIPPSKKWTLKRRLKDAKILMKESRGKKKTDL